MPVPTAVPPSGSSPMRGKAGLEPLDRESHGRRVAAELLPERDRRGVHEMGAAALHHGRELVGLAGQRSFEMLQRRDQGLADRAGRSDVYRRRKRVVRRLRRVDVVVRMHRRTESFGGERGEYLVRVHVARRTGPGLEHVDGEMRVPVASRDFGRGVVDGIRDGGVEHSEFGVHECSRAFDRRERADEIAVDHEARRRGSCRLRAGSARATWRREEPGPRPCCRARRGRPAQGS